MIGEIKKSSGKGPPGELQSTWIVMFFVGVLPLFLHLGWTANRVTCNPLSIPVSASGVSTSGLSDRVVISVLKPSIKTKALLGIACCLSPAVHNLSVDHLRVSVKAATASPARATTTAARTVAWSVVHAQTVAIQHTEITLYRCWRGVSNVSLEGFNRGAK